MFSTHVLDLAAQCGVRQVLAVPRQQIVHAVRCCDGNLDRVGNRSFEQRQFFDQLLGQRCNIGSQGQQRNALDFIKPLACRSFIPAAGFLDNRLRDKEVEKGASYLPPVLRDLLIRSEDQVAAWTSRQIADDCGFEMDSELRHACETFRACVRLIIRPPAPDS